MSLNSDEERSLEQLNDPDAMSIPENVKASEQVYEKANSAVHMKRRNELHNDNNKRQKLLKNRKRRLNKKIRSILFYMIIIFLIVAIGYLYWQNRTTVSQWFDDLYESILELF